MNPSDPNKPVKDSPQTKVLKCGCVTIQQKSGNVIAVELQQMCAEHHKFIIRTAIDPIKLFGEK